MSVMSSVFAAAIVAAACTSERTRTTPAADANAELETGRRSASDRAAATSYVGLAYTSPPAGVTFLSGAALSSPGDTRGNYAFARVATPNGEMIWLDTIAAQTKIVRAELSLPPLANDERLFVSTCDLAGRLNQRVIAVAVEKPNTTRFGNVRQAWLANLKDGRFDIIPVAGVVCEDLESGPS